MSKTTITISFRCPPEILEQIDSIGREYFPKTDNSRTNSGCDRSKTLFAIIQAGIAAWVDGEASVLQSKTDNENSKTDINLDEVRALVKKLVSENMPNEGELSQLIKKEISNSFEKGDIADKIQDIRDEFATNFNEFSENFTGKLAKLESLVIEENKTDILVTNKLEPTIDKKEPSEEDKADIINALNIQKILRGEERYSKNSSNLFDLVQQHKRDIESKLGVKIGDMTNYPVREFNKVLKKLGCEYDFDQRTVEEGRLSEYFVIQK